MFIDLIERPIGRRPGSLCKFKCVLCGAVELVTGGTANFRCSECRNPGHEWKANYKEVQIGRRDASAAVARAVADGELPRPASLPCTDCGKPATEYDHRDYNKPLQVAAVCRSCNRQRGHAIPRAGYFEECIERGVVPFTLKVRVARFLRNHGFVIKSLDDMPKKLSFENWQVLFAEMQPQMQLIYPHLRKPAQ